VLEIANRTVGSVVREAETLFVLVPRNVPLQAEINVEGKDIGQIAVGQPVRIKFEAFPFQKYGTGSGVVRVVSQDTFCGPIQREKVRVECRLHITGCWWKSPIQSSVFPKRIQMIPGMAVTAELKVGTSQRDLILPVSAASRTG